MSFDKFLLAVESRDLSQVDKSIIQSLTKAIIFELFYYTRNPASRASKCACLVVGSICPTIPLPPSYSPANAKSYSVLVELASLLVVLIPQSILRNNITWITQPCLHSYLWKQKRPLTASMVSEAEKKLLKTWLLMSLTTCINSFSW